jgi:hypothetical protein
MVTDISPESACCPPPPAAAGVGVTLPPLPPCTVHPRRELDMYCALCEVVMCITCKETSHARCLQKWDEEAKTTAPILCEYVTTSRD